MQHWRRDIDRAGLRAFAILLACVLGTGCSVKRIAVNSLANTLSASGDTFSADDDPELIRAAVPFALKTYELLLASAPTHAGLLLATCSGFTQYSYAFVQTDADLLGADEYDSAKQLRERSLKLYLRARGYCLRALELRHRGITDQLMKDPVRAVASAKAEEVPLLYWTGASWGAAISLGLDRPELVADFPAVRAMMTRALALDERYARGALHEVMITLDSVPEAMGGSLDRAREHFTRAVSMQQGQSAGPYVALAMGVAVPNQDRAEFERLLNTALAVDPEQDRSNRLVNLITQRRARRLLEKAGDLFSGSPRAHARREAVLPVWAWTFARLPRE